MKLTISNIVWKSYSNYSYLKILKKNKIKSLEYAPDIILQGNYTAKNILEVKKYWDANKIRLYSMQSLLFGLQNAYLFGNKKQKNIFLNEIIKKIDLAHKLGSKVLVFGSPKNRIIFNKKKIFLEKTSIEIFSKIADYCKNKKIYFCLEANPKLYGCEYINSTMEAISLIRKINKPYFKLNLDLGTIIENKENISEIISKNFNLIKHVQISTPYLRGISRYKSKIKKLIYYLYKFKYKGHVSIEMIEKKNNNIKIVSQSISIVKLMFK
tara:strand:- start:873 stop:1676 length:804 start_codon:yes stop_codon:yes gene_type:complete